MTITRFHVQQPPGSSLCGQACVAMILGIRLEHATSLVGHARSTKPYELADALRKREIKCGDRRIRYTGGTLPKRAFLAISAWNSRRRYHWVLLYDGLVYDPALCAPMPVRGYLRCNDGLGDNLDLTSYLPIGEV